MAPTPYVPLPPEVFDAPLPVVAYADEPDAVELDLRIERMMDELDDWRNDREVRLLQAVVLDLHALEFPEDELLGREAMAAAWILRETDDSLGTSTGKHPPFADEWHSSGASRPYVRQEYLQYRTRPAAEPVPAAAVPEPTAPVEPRRVWWDRLLDPIFTKWLGWQRIEE